MRVATVNLWNGRSDAADLARLLEELAPDLLVAQEVGPKAARVLERHFAHGEVEGATDFSGRAMVGQVEVEVEPLPLPHRPGWRGVFQLDGEEVEVLGVHLHNPIDGWGRIGQRRDQVDHLLPLLHRPGRRLLAGDLNATPIWPAYRRLTGPMLDGVAEWARREGRRAPRTWGHRPWWPPVLRIDHVLVRGIRVTDARTHRVARNDHRLLAVEVELADGPTGGEATW